MGFWEFHWMVYLCVCVAVLARTEKKHADLDEAKEKSIITFHQ